MTDLQLDVLDRLAIDGWDGREPVYCGNMLVCHVTGRCPTIIQSMTDAECRTVLALWDHGARMEEQRRERAQKIERLHRAGRWGRVMLNAMGVD
jgi:hypothetical protein